MTEEAVKLKLNPLLLVSIFLFSLLTVLPLQIPEVKAQENPSPVGSIVDTLYVDWSRFWQKFNRHALWDLEWYDSSSLEWLSIKSDLQIIRDYPEENICKITLIFDASHSGNYRLTFGIDARVKKYVTKLAQYQYELNYDEFSVVFDWSDVISISGLIITHGIKNVDGKDYFWFRMRKDNIKQGAHVEIDPTVIGTSTVAFPTRYPSLRKVWFVSNYYWVFYSNGSFLVYRTSSDGDSWSAETVIKTCDDGDEFSIYSNSSSLFHYAFCSGGGGDDLLYNYGAISDNTILWDSDKVVVSPLGDQQIRRPCMTISSTGYAWIGYQLTDMDPTTHAYLYAVKAANLDGSSWGTPKKLWDVADAATEMAVPIPLSSDKIYLIYRSHGRLWNGTDWEDEEESSGEAMGIKFSASSDDNDYIYLTYLKSVVFTHTIKFAKRTTSWQTREVIGEGEDKGYPTITINASTGDFAIFWTKSDEVKSREYRSGWGSVKSFASATNLKETSLQSFYNSTNSQTGVVWANGSSLPYDVNFAFFTFTTGTYKLNLRTYTSDSAVLPSCQVTMNNGSDHAKSSDANGWANYTGITVLSVSVKVEWQSLLVNSTFIVVDSDKTVNILTYVQRLVSSSNYLLFGLNNTELPTPSLLGSYNWQMPSVTASGTIPFKMDNLNWIKTAEPYSFTAGDNTYTKGTGSWSFSDNIFTFNVPFSTKTLSMSWDAPAPPDGDGGGGGYVPPEEEIPPLEIPPIIPPVVLPPAVVAPPALMGTGAVVIILVVGGAIVYGELERKKPTPRRVWKKRAPPRKVKWKKRKEPSVKWPKTKQKKRPSWKREKLFD
ncbi:MAG: hypothetical protein HWN68_07785 [Desulfobacterales bacterium]|nr:hypothetical protein [Desulfobacterales bacterium]